MNRVRIKKWTYRLDRYYHRDSPTYTICKPNGFEVRQGLSRSAARDIVAGCNDPLNATGEAEVTLRIYQSGRLP